MKLFFHLILISSFLIVGISNAEGRYQILADPDLVGFNYEYYGAPSIKAGDFLNFSFFSFGGFFEARNEKRFTQAPLPNHNWRGFFFLSGKFPVLNTDIQKLNIFSGFEHESAHPSQGFWENNDSAYEMIYDNQYRNIHLNSLFIRTAHHFQITSSVELKYILDYQFYAFAKNTPELHNSDLGFSNGFSIGVELQWQMPYSLIWYFSLFDRIILEGWQKREDLIYINSVAGPVTQSMKYPIINSVNTFSCKTGIIYNLKSINRLTGIYIKVLYGNIFGLVDSRENRFIISGGIELFH